MSEFIQVKEEKASGSDPVISRTVALKGANGKYVSADLNQGGILIANRDKLT